jgi:hypothetical protein
MKNASADILKVWIDLCATAGSSSSAEFWFDIVLQLPPRLATTDAIKIEYLLRNTTAGQASRGTPGNIPPDPNHFLTSLQPLPS